MKLKKLNKRGEGFDIARKSIYWMIASIVSIIAIFALVFIFTIHQGKLISQPPELEAELIALRFVNNPDCFAYQDPITSRVYTGTIDLEKYTQENLDKCYYTEEDTGHETYNFGLLLEPFDMNGEVWESEILSTNNYFNHVDFTLYEEVIVRSEGNNIPATLVIYVQSSI